jgi:amino acid permease
MATSEPGIKYLNRSDSQSVKDGESSSLPDPPINEADGKLHRELSARQVQMIAIAGTIGTGLFLGTGSSLAQGGPASILICYTIVGFIVYVTLLLLGEMGTQYPVTGSFGHYCTRFFSPSYGFALAWNYWGGRAIALAGDLVSAQIIMSFWTDWHPWAVALLFWVFLVIINAVHVKAYGELGE